MATLDLQRNARLRELLARPGLLRIPAQAKAATDLWTYDRDHGKTKGFLDRMMAPADWSDLIGNAAETSIRDLLED